MRPWRADLSNEEAAALEHFAPTGIVLTTTHQVADQRRLRPPERATEATAPLVVVSVDLRRQRELGERLLCEVEGGGEYLLRAPAELGSPIATECFRTHTAICIWPEPAHGDAPTWFVYWGARLWDFSEAFALHGTVLLRGRGCTGPWAHKK